MATTTPHETTATTLGAPLRPLRVLLVESRTTDGATARELLARQVKGRFAVDWHRHYDAGLSAIRERRHDVYLIGCRLGDRSGLDLVREGLGGPPSAPVILLADQAGPELEMDAMALGVTDHLVTHELDPSGLERSIRYALGHHGAVADLARSEERYALAMDRLQHEALHDLLTGLPNRTLFMERVREGLQRAARDPRTGCAVLFVDADRFKLVNDSLGHAAGDTLLVALARRLAVAVRPGDTVARLGGDEFAILLEDIADPADAAAVVQRILRALDRPFDVDGHDLFASVSIGIALGGPQLDAAGLIGDADIAMYNAKRRGRGRSAVFHDSMRRSVVDRLARENALRHVIEAQRLSIHYQPIVDLGTGEICGMEALARWPQGQGALAPSEFISIAEDTGIIGALGQQVLACALATLAGWRREGLIGDGVCMSVNLSVRQLDDPGLADQVRAAIALSQLPPQALKLEITESTLTADLERTQQVFAEVCAGGVGLHLDDFGTGYSSLSALHRFPVDAIKIDRSFVADLAGPGEASDVIVRSTVAMAHSLGLPVIAEGIETPDQLRRLRAVGCEFGQGHLFSPALSAGDARQLLAGWDPSSWSGSAHARG
ncbi:MAG TPA: EAL domain-containing protein [Solirubrobacteraceae bacterium]|jgi:diguanylate cyclase (GGDEF)-like protein|nr:EAL domain-containing protein [Solirubrobacteraceae bacterium]